MKSTRARNLFMRELPSIHPSDARDIPENSGAHDQLSLSSDFQMHALIYETYIYYCYYYYYY